MNEKRFLPYGKSKQPCGLEPRNGIQTIASEENCGSSIKWQSSSSSSLTKPAVQLKICDSHLTCKVANKCLNVCEQVEVLEWNKKWSSPFPCFAVRCQCP